MILPVAAFFAQSFGKAVTGKIQKQVCLPEFLYLQSGVPNVWVVSRHKQNAPANTATGALEHGVGNDRLLAVPGWVGILCPQLLYIEETRVRDKLT